MFRQTFKSKPETRPTWTEAYRHECECRALLNMTESDRIAMIEGVENPAGGRPLRDGIRRKRGDAAAKRIYDTMSELRDARRRERAAARSQA